MIWLQALPLISLVLLLASGRAGPFIACGAALIASLPAIVTAIGVAAVPIFVAVRTTEAVWLALPPLGIVLGGLLFHAAVRRPPPREQSRDAIGSAFVAAFLLGPFAESVTGFGVGMVFAIGALRQAGFAGAYAAGIGLISQALIEWGGLGPGTALGAALAGTPAQDVAAQNAVQAAVWFVLLLPLFWRIAAHSGHPVPAARRPAQVAWVASVGVLLIVAAHLLPWEVSRLLATGIVLCVRLLRDDLPQDRQAMRRTMVIAGPYLLLTTMLLATRLWHGAPCLKPYSEFPPIGLDHPMVALWVAALLVAVARGVSASELKAALLHGRRPALAILIYVILARWLFGAGVPHALASALERGFGGFAPFAAPFVGAASGFVAGTNVGSNSTAMTLQAELGKLYGLDPVLLPSVQNFVGASVILLSPQINAVAGSLAGESRISRIWRLMWPVAPIAIAIGLASVAIGRVPLVGTR